MSRKGDFKPLKQVPFQIRITGNKWILPGVQVHARHNRICC